MPLVRLHAVRDAARGAQTRAFTAATATALTLFASLVLSARPAAAQFVFDGPASYLIVDGTYAGWNYVDFGPNVDTMVTMKDAAELHYARLFHQSQLDLFGNHLGGLEVHTLTIANVHGGSVDKVFLTDQGALNVDGGSVGYAQLIQHTLLTQSGGNVDSAELSGDSRFLLSGGSVGTVTASGSSALTITGGSIGAHTLYALDSSRVTIHGNGLALSSATAGSFSGYDGTFYDLMGTLEDGTQVDTSLFWANSFNGNSVQPQVTLINGTAGAAPEPGALALLAVGMAALGLIRHRV